MIDRNREEKESQKDSRSSQSSHTGSRGNPERSRDEQGQFTGGESEKDNSSQNKKK
jgi:hypothetical protein